MCFLVRNTATISIQQTLQFFVSDSKSEYYFLLQKIALDISANGKDAYRWPLKHFLAELTSKMPHQSELSLLLKIFSTRITVHFQPESETQFATDIIVVGIGSNCR